MENTEMEDEDEIIKLTELTIKYLVYKSISKSKIEPYFSINYVLQYILKYKPI